jgi:hypothetical protein
MTTVRASETKPQPLRRTPPRERYRRKARPMIRLSWSLSALTKLGIAAALALPLFVAACASESRLAAESVALEPQAQAIPGGPIRFLVARDTSGLVEEGRNAFKRELAWRASNGQTGPLPPADGDLYELYTSARRDGIDYNLAFVPADFNVPHREQFDTHYMRELFAVARNLSIAGYPWQKYPPGYIAPLRSAAQ